MFILLIYTSDIYISHLCLSITELHLVLLPVVLFFQTLLKARISGPTADQGTDSLGSQILASRACLSFPQRSLGLHAPLLKIDKLPLSVSPPVDSNCEDNDQYLTLFDDNPEGESVLLTPRSMLRMRVEKAELP